MKGARAERVLVIAAAAALAACRGPGTAADEIVLLNDQSVPRLDPRYAATTWEAKLSQLVAPGLRGLKDRGLGPTAGLAESLTQEGPLSYLARLRSDARFSDGKPVTAADVKYTFDSLRDPLLGSSFRKTWDEYLAGVDIVDERSVRFRLRAPRAPFPTDLEGAGIVARHAVEERDRQVREAARAGRRLPPGDSVREVIGAGPYKIARHSTDSIELARNPYSTVQPATPRLTVRTIRDDNARVLALLGGSADVMLNGVTLMMIETLKGDPRLEVRFGASATLQYLGFNLDDPILRDRRVRQAIALALDRQRLVAAKLGGLGRLASSPLDAENPFFVKDLRRWNHDPVAARRLLDEAGFPDPDGAGPRPRFSLSWKTSAIRWRVALVQAMARQLEEVGIAVDVRPFEFGTFLDDVKKGNAQLFTLQAVDLVEPDMMRAWLHQSRIPTAEKNWTGNNRFRYRNPAFDRLLDEGATTDDPERRRELYRQVQAIIMEDLPMLPLWHEDNVMVYRRGIKDLEVLKTGRLEGLLVAVKPGAEAR